MAKESFILYTSFYEPLKILSEKQLGKLFKAIFDYQINGNTQVDSDIQMAFAFIKNQLDIDNGKYQEKIRKNAENGRRGGRPPRKDNQTEKANGKIKSEKSERLFEKANKADNDNEYDNDIPPYISPKGYEQFSFDFIQADFADCMNLWLEYKRSRNQKYKTQETIETCYRKMLEGSGNDPVIAMKMIEESMSNNWAGFFPLKNQKLQTNEKPRTAGTAGYNIVRQDSTSSKRT